MRDSTSPRKSSVRPPVPGPSGDRRADPVTGQSCSDRVVEGLAPHPVPLSRQGRTTEVERVVPVKGVRRHSSRASARGPKARHTEVGAAFSGPSFCVDREYVWGRKGGSQGAVGVVPVPGWRDRRPSGPSGPSWASGTSKFVLAASVTVTNDPATSVLQTHKTLSSDKCGYSFCIRTSSRTFSGGVVSRGPGSPSLPVRNIAGPGPRLGRPPNLPVGTDVRTRV